HGCGLCRESSSAARSRRRESHAGPGHAARSERFTEGTGADDPRGAACEDEAELRAGQGLGHASRLAADEGAARAEAAGDTAEPADGAAGDQEEEVPNHPPAKPPDAPPKHPGEKNPGAAGPPATPPATELMLRRCAARSLRALTSPAEACAFCRR